MSFIEQRKWHELQLLSRTGLGIEPVAPGLCRVLREIVGVEAASVFWVDEDGMPVGYFHEHAPDSARELFVNEYDEFFTGENELNVSQLAQRKDRKIGHLAWADESYFRSNTYNLLIRASGHRHTLDMRVEAGGRARAVLMLFRTGGSAFSDEDAKRLERTSPYLERLIASRGESLGWEPAGLPGHMMFSADGSSVTFMDASAEGLLRMTGLVGQNIRLMQPAAEAPAFLTQLCRDLGGAILTRTLPVPSGRLMLSARAMRNPRASAEAQVMVTLQLEQSRDLKLLDRVLAFDISPMQREIVMMAGQGVSRLDALPKLGISNEALKKHLAAIYAASGVNRWEDLAAA